MTHSECSCMKSRIVLALSVSDLRPPGLSQASESRSRWASPYCDVKTRARVVLPEPELPNTTMRRITFETARLTRIRLQSAIYFWLYLRAVCRKTLQNVKPGLGQKPVPCKNSGKKLYVTQNRGPLA